MLDGNVERVMARLYDIHTPLPAAKPDLMARAQALTPTTLPGDYAQAVMDLGATICTPKSPACGICPWRDPCLARRNGIGAVEHSGDQHEGPAEQQGLRDNRAAWHHELRDEGTEEQQRLRVRPDYQHTLPEILLPAKRRGIARGGNLGIFVFVPVPDHIIAEIDQIGGTDQFDVDEEGAHRLDHQLQPGSQYHQHDRQSELGSCHIGQPGA